MLTGSPLTDMEIEVIAGRAHLKHTEGGDFRQSTYRAIRHGLMYAKSVLLEPIYDYEIVFYPDREDDKELRGLICGIRLANSVLTTMRNKFTHSFVNKETENEDLVAKTLLANHDATLILNLNDHSFEIYKESGTFKTRNDYVPDFESFIQSYIKRDVHFEDAPRLLELTKVDNIKTALHEKSLLSIPYRDISSGKPLHYLIRITGGENNLAAMIITNINNEFVLAKQNTQKLEEDLWILTYLKQANNICMH